MKDPVCGMDVNEKMILLIITEKNIIFVVLAADGHLNMIQSSLFQIEYIIMKFKL